MLVEVTGPMDDVVRKLRRECAKHRTARNEARTVLADVRAELEAVKRELAALKAN